MPRSKCRWKWKIAHPTKAEAEKHAAELRRKGARGMGAYPCPAGHWHVGNNQVKRRNPKPRKRRL